MEGVLFASQSNHDVLESVQCENHPSCWAKPPEKDAKKASDLKAEGNKCFAAKDFEEAINLYSRAIELNPEDDDHAYSTVRAYTLCLI